MGNNQNKSMGNNQNKSIKGGVIDESDFVTLKRMVLTILNEEGYRPSASAISPTLSTPSSLQSASSAASPQSQSATYLSSREHGLRLFPITGTCNSPIILTEINPPQPFSAKISMIEKY